MSAYGNAKQNRRKQEISCNRTNPKQKSVREDWAIISDEGTGEGDEEIAQLRELWCDSFSVTLLVWVNKCQDTEHDLFLEFLRVNCC